MRRIIPVRPRFSRQTFLLVLKVAAGAVNLTAAVAALTPLVLLSIAAIATAASHHDRAAQLLGAFAGGGLVALVGGVLALRPAFRRLTRGYRWRTAEFIYRIDPDEPWVHHQTVKVEVEAISPWFRVFENRYHWTGEGEEEVPRLVNPAGTLFGPVKGGIWNYYYVHLSRALDVGETTLIETEQRLFDRENRFVPQLTKTVIEPIDDLVLRVIFPRHLFPKEIRAFAGYPEPVDRRETLVPTLNSEAGEARLDVQRPVYGRRYWLEWDREG